MLRVWGKAGVVKLKTTSTPKLGNCGTVCIFIGYSKMHLGDCYRMYNPGIKRVHTTQDVKWLNGWYYDADGNKIKNDAFNNDSSKARKGVQWKDELQGTLEEFSSETGSESDSLSNEDNKDDDTSVNEPEMISMDDEELYSSPPAR